MEQSGRDDAFKVITEGALSIVRLDRNGIQSLCYRGLNLAPHLSCDKLGTSGAKILSYSRTEKPIRFFR